MQCVSVMLIRLARLSWVLIDRFACEVSLLCLYPLHSWVQAAELRANNAGLQATVTAQAQQLQQLTLKVGRRSGHSFVGYQ
jgi:hypothetical protein